MLKLVVELVMLREELSNSGTKLSWKIAHYGLPAAGIILLAMLNPNSTPPCLRTTRSSVLQDLTVLTMEIEKGTVAKAGDANYALLTKATQTIHRFLDFTLSDKRAVQLTTVPQLPEGLQNAGTWEQQLGQDFLESEWSFWDNMADHPSLFSHYLLTEDEGLDGPSLPVTVAGGS
ncbi:hypothetical protein NW759_017120 [Fusarium solani]|nr:hypothetical protein NW759_017120 [Fusarium solani]